MQLPADHPERRRLHDEVHARPTVPLKAPARLTSLALLDEGTEAADRRAHLCALLTRFGQPLPAADANHHFTDLGPFRVKWEQHTEFTRYIFAASGADTDPFARTALDLVPRDWLAALPGSLLLAAHAAVLPDEEMPADNRAILVKFFGDDPLIGATIAGGLASAFTDFRIDANGFSRILIYDRGMRRHQTGRAMQLLFEIETYRLAALLALPVARLLAPELARMEHELSAIALALSQHGAAQEAAQDQELLDRLIALSADIESRQSIVHFRFSASAAYHDLVLRRIGELREIRIEGLQTFGEFIERRLAPAMATCRSTAARLDALSARVARATQLLSTRVEITREYQNQAILASLNRRAELQLLLQQAVEGLSVAAVTYYAVGLVAYFTKGLKAAHLPVNPDMVAACTVPVIAILMLRAVHRVRKSVGH